ncbi:MAG: DUF5107 domain-containing protein [Clostridia bacterium]
MANIRKGTITLSACAYPQENPLPRLRDCAFDTNFIDSGLLSEERGGFNYSTGVRVLPYCVQDGYDRSRSQTKLDTVVLENDCLRATFLPRYGGRLYSLYHKMESRELLFSNPVMQTANLAVRDAWFSGGIEWNLGQYGHSSLTVAPVYFARMTDCDGHAFLRMYEYERIKGLFMQLDFYLPEHDNHLYVHAKLTNPHDTPRSFYWWTNIAVPLERNVRVLSGTDQVIATMPISGTHALQHDTLPYLHMLPGHDASFPEQFPFSAEYFFQNPSVPECVWEAVAYNDGTAFYERSTLGMAYRKMFTWSNQPGGHHWQHQLSTDDAPLYLEIQSGVSRTQLHGSDLPGGETVRFTQAFGGTTGLSAASLLNTAFTSACKQMYAELEHRLPYAKLSVLDESFTALETRPPEEVLFSGSCCAAIEELRDDHFIPHGLLFSHAYTPAEEDWATFAVTGTLPELTRDGFPVYVTDEAWLPRFERAYAQGGQPQASFFLALALHESGCFQRAALLFQQAAVEMNLPVCWRTLAMHELARGEAPHAYRAMERAIAAGAQHPAYFAEYLVLLNALQRYEQAWFVFESAPEPAKQDEHVRLQAAKAALALNRLDFLSAFLSGDYAGIREGEVSLTELWYGLRAKQLVHAHPISEEDALLLAQNETPPYRIDFRTN